MKGKSRRESWHSHNLKATFRGRLISFLVYEMSVHMCVFASCNRSVLICLNPKGKTPNYTPSKDQDICFGLMSKGIPWSLLFLSAVSGASWFISFPVIYNFQEVLLYIPDGKKTIINLSFPYFMNEEWFESLMENISGKNVSSRRLQVCSFQLPKRLTEDIYVKKQACVKSYRLQNISLLWVKATALGNQVCLSQGS